MTQKAHVAALEPVTRILPDTGPLGPERETPPSSAAFLYKTIDDDTTGSSSWVPPSPSAPSTPETAIRGPIPLTNTSTDCQPASRARYARVGGVRLCTDLRCSPPTYEELHCKTKRRRTWGTAFLTNRRQRPAIRGEEIRRLPGSQRVSARSPRRMANVYRILPSDRHSGGASRRWFATLRPYCAPSEQ